MGQALRLFSAAACCPAKAAEEPPAAAAAVLPGGGCRFGRLLCDSLFALCCSLANQDSCCL